MIQTPASPDVLVVGAGPTGLVAACELVRHGATVRVIDKSSGPSSKSKALAIFPRTLEVFEAMGIVGQVTAEGHPLHGLSVHDDKGGRLVHLAFNQLSSPFRFVLSLPQSETERILEKHLAGLGVKVERETEWAGCIQNEQGVEVTIRQNAASPGGAEEHIKTRWLIGCDGAHSGLRQLLGLEFEGAQYDESFILADVALTVPEALRETVSSDEVHLFLSPDGLLAVIPFGTGRARIVADVSRAVPPNPAEPTLQEVERLLQYRGLAGASASDAAWLSRFNISRRKVRQFRIGRIFLAGDAAHIHSPAGGQGMNVGIQDAFNLAWKLALVAKGRSPVSLLASYNAEREPVARRVLHLTDTLTRIATLHNPMAQQLRDVLLPLVTGVEAVEERIIENLAELNVNYRRSPIVASYEASGLRAGDRAPDAQLLDAITSKTVNLFEILAETRHVLLLFAGAEAESRPAQVEVRQLLRRIESDYADAVVVRTLGYGDYHAGTPGTNQLIDQSGLAHKLYGAVSGAAVLVRPDWYIGFRSDLGSAEKRLREYLRAILIPVAMRSAA